MSINMFMLFFLLGCNGSGSRPSEIPDSDKHVMVMVATASQCRLSVKKPNCCGFMLYPMFHAYFHGTDMPIPVWLVQILRRLLELPRLLFQSE